MRVLASQALAQPVLRPMTREDISAHDLLSEVA